MTMGRSREEIERENAELARQLRERDRERVENPGKNWKPVEPPPAEPPKKK